MLKKVSKTTPPGSVILMTTLKICLTILTIITFSRAIQTLNTTFIGLIPINGKVLILHSGGVGTPENLIQKRLLL